MTKNERGNWTISMFLGMPTETDNKELADYIKTMVKSDLKKFQRMNDRFNINFPGLRTAVVNAEREVLITSGLKVEQLEVIDGKARARNKHVTSEWYSTELKEGK